MITRAHISKWVKDIISDKSVMYSLLGTVWRMVFAPISLFLVALKLTPELQGYYYLFFSIAGMQAIIEAGFSHTLVQSISHEMEGVRFENHNLYGDNDKLQNIREAMRAGFFWYTIVAVSCIAVIFPIGIYIIGSEHWTDFDLWFKPWLLFIICFSLNIFLYPVNFFFEGILHLDKIYKNRLIIQILSSVFFIVAILGGANLYSIIVFSLTGYFVNLTQLFIPNYKLFSDYIFNRPSKYYIRSTYKWQLKVSAVWCTGYLYWQLPTVIIFSMLGPIVSGQYSMTVHVINSVMNIGQVFVKTKAAIIGELRASGHFLEAFALYRKNSIYSYVFIACSMVGIVLFWYLFPNFIVWSRILPSAQTAILGVAFAITMITINQAMFARCSKEEPFFMISMFVNFAFPALLLLSLSLKPNTWAVVATFVVIHLIEFVWGILKFRKLYGYVW